MSLIFRPNSEIQTFEGRLFSYWGGLESPPPPPPPWLRYCLLILLVAGTSHERVGVIVNWDTKPHKKKRRFVAWKFVNSPIAQKPLDVQSWNLNAMWVLIIALCKPRLEAPGHVIKISRDKNGQKVDEFESIYLGNYRYWWKMACDFWEHYQPPFFWLCWFAPPWIPFFLLTSFFFFFPAIYFEAPERTVFKV